MHELPFVTELVRISAEEAVRQGLQRVSRVDVVTGELTSLEDEAIRMYFEAVAEGTPCEGAGLFFEHTRAMLRCARCGKEFPHLHGFQCPSCGGDGMLVKGSGRECYVKSIAGCASPQNGRSAGSAKA